MIRVLHSVSNMDRAGIETMLMNYYRYIDRGRIQFDFLCNKEKPGDYDAEILSLGGRIFHSPGLNPIKRPAYMRFMKETLSNNPDIRILHAHNEAMAEYALEGAKKAGLNVRIFHSHNTRIEMNFKWPLKMLCKQFLRFNYTDMWACGRDAAVYYFGERNVAAGKVHILHNAVDLSRFSYSPEVGKRLREEYKLGDGFVIGHIGRFNVQKNHKFLIEAFAAVRKSVPDARLALIGVGELQDEARTLVEKLGVASDVVFTGPVDNACEWYSAMDVFAMPSIFEGLPVVGVEAQANGLKCLFSDKVSREVNISGDSEYLPLEVGAWAERLISLKGVAHNPAYAGKARQSGYDIETEAVKLQAIYEEMAGR